MPADLANMLMPIPAHCWRSRQQLTAKASPIIATSNTVRAPRTAINRRFKFLSPSAGHSQQPPWRCWAVLAAGFCHLRAHTHPGARQGRLGASQESREAALGAALTRGGKGILKIAAEHKVGSSVVQRLRAVESPPQLGSQG
jgi:hypothetical protein